MMMFLPKRAHAACFRQTRLNVLQSSRNVQRLQVDGFVRYASSTVNTTEGKGLENKEYKALVIGGGVIGTSVLYHLTKLGWNNVALLERKVLTAGSTWHAAGGFHALNGDPTVARLQSYTIQLYKEIEEKSGQSCGVQYSGGVNFALTEERWQYLKNEHSRHRTMGIDSQLLSPEQVKEFCPIMQTEGVIGGLFDANEGYLDCSGVTWAYAKCAQLGGAKIHQHTKVEGMRQVPRQDNQQAKVWEVVTDKGTVYAEHVVNCGGLWAREVAKMAGVHLPLLPMSHHYVVTEGISEVKRLREEEDKRFFILDLDGETYMRTEQDGLLIGVYEQDCLPWAADKTPWEYGETDLLQPELDRIEPELSNAYERYPALNDAGLKTIVNGPFTFAPDGNPLVGPIEGTGLETTSISNYWVAAAVMAGFSQGGGVGLSLSEWMVYGQPRTFPDVFAMDVARYGKWATKAYTHLKSQENYQRRFRIAYPNEELPVARNIKLSPLHLQHKEDSAVFGTSYGLEFPKYFARGTEDKTEIYTYMRSNSFDTVAEECYHVRNLVGVTDMSTFSKYRVTGKSAKEFLDKLLACRIPKPGRMARAPMLNEDGKLMGELTVVNHAVPDLDGNEQFQLIGSGYLQGFHMRWLSTKQREMGMGETTKIENCTDTIGGIYVAGPNSRSLLERLVETPDVMGHDNFKFMDSKTLSVGLVPCTVSRVSVSGELGFEIQCEASQLYKVYSELRSHGKDLGLKPFGSYALNSLRLEKSFGIWSREYTPEFTALESALDPFVSWKKKTEFIGKAAALEEKTAETSKWRLVTFTLDSDKQADCWGYEPVWTDNGNTYIGFTTSGGYGHHVKRSIAMAMIDKQYLDESREFSIHLIGDDTKATLETAPLYDPTGAKMFKS